MKPFRFGLQTHGASDGKTFRDKARQLEDLGYSTMFMPDHFGDQWAPTVGITIAAEATETLKVGTLVYDNDYRHPVVLAKEAATLDLATEGRFEFGLGAGWMNTDYAESGIPHDSAGTRIERLEESLQILKALWRDGTATFSGKHYTVNGAQGHPRPHTKPHPKILIGGGGKKLLSLAAREADIVGVTATAKTGAIDQATAQTAVGDLMRQRLQWIKDAAGDRFDDLEIQGLTFFFQVSDDRDQVFENMAPLFGLTPQQAAETPLALVGTIDQLCETLQERRETYGHNYVVVQDEAMLDFAPVVARLTGT